MKISATFKNQLNGDPFVFLFMHKSIDSYMYLQCTTIGLVMSALRLIFLLKSSIQLTELGTPLSGQAVK